VDAVEERIEEVRDDIEAQIEDLERDIRRG